MAVTVEVVAPVAVTVAMIATAEVAAAATVAVRNVRPAVHRRSGNSRPEGLRCSLAASVLTVAV